MKVYIDVGRGEFKIEIDSFGVTGDDVTRIDSKLFFVYLVLFVLNAPI